MFTHSKSRVNFYVLGRILPVKVESVETLHYIERNTRMKEYKELMNNNFIYSFIVDKLHENGPEYHSINSNGLIYIHNARTKRLITVLHPRPTQLKRYFNELGIKVPQKINKLAQECYLRNEERELNNK